MGYDPIEDVELKDVTENELKAKGVVSLATRPNAPSRYGEGGLTAEALKAKFDGLARALADRINNIHNYLRADDLADKIKVDINAVGASGIPTLAALAEAIESGEAAKYLTVGVGAEGRKSLQEAIFDILKDISDHGEESDENFRSTNARINRSVATINIEPVVNGRNITIVLTAMNDQGEVVTTDSINVPNADNLIASHNESTNAHQDIRGLIQSNGMQIDSLREDIADVRVVAEGRVRARAYSTWDDALLAISNFRTLEDARKEFAIGDQIYIRTPKSTDAWVSGFETRHEPYPGGLGDDLDPFDKWESTEIHVGYLIISPLESPDVDLTGYVTTDDFDEYGEKVDNDIADAKAHSVAEAKAYTAVEVAGVSDRVDILDKKVEKLRAALSPEYFVTDSAVEYTKQVPASALPFAEVQEVGGMSYAVDGVLKNAAVTALETVGANILDISAALNECLRDNGDGTYTITRTSNNRFSAAFPLYSPVNGRIYTYMEIVTSYDGFSGSIPIQFFGEDRKTEIGSASLVNNGAVYATSNGAQYARLYLNANALIGGSVTFRKPMIKYGTEVAPYAPYTRRTYPIPAEVQALEGWGLGVNETYHNRIDWEKKQYRREVGIIDMGSLSYSMRESNGRYIFGAYIPNIVGYADGDLPLPAVAVGYRGVRVNDIWVDGDMAYGSTAIGYTKVEFINNAYTDAMAFKTAMSGRMIVYALATPIITDISHILPDDNLIEVEGGGTITAVNENELDAPTKIEYQLKEATA